MALIIFAIIIGIPVIELMVLIDVGGEIGAFSTVILCLATAAAGLSLVRMQGVRVLSDMQTKTQTGEPVGENLIHGFFLLIAGVFLFIPGFITDFFGAMLLIPFIRLALGRAGMAHMVVRSNFRTGPFGHKRQKQKPGENKDNGITIDGEYKHYEEYEAQSEDVEINITPPQKDTDKE